MDLLFAHKSPTPEPDDNPIPEDEPDPDEDPVPHPDPVVRPPDSDISPPTAAASFLMPSPASAAHACIRYTRC